MKRYKLRILIELVKLGSRLCSRGSAYLLESEKIVSVSIRESVDRENIVFVVSYNINDASFIYINKNTYQTKASFQELWTLWMGLKKIKR